MKRNNLWRWLFVVFVLGWSMWELYPLKDRPLIDAFEEMATNQDEKFQAIVKEARALAATGSGSAYNHLLAAAGDTALTNYFPNYRPDGEVKANAYILNKVQRKAAGEVRLGIDLKGGTSFRLAMDMDALRSTMQNTNTVAGRTNAVNTNPTVTPYERQAALSQAVEVLRRRVDRLGVAEPVIQPVGEDQIVVQ